MKNQQMNFIVSLFQCIIQRSMTRADVVVCDYRRTVQYIIEGFPKIVIKPKFMSHLDIMENGRTSIKNYIWGRIY